MENNELKKKAVEFWKKKSQREDVTEESVIFELTGTSIKFVESICEMEEEIDCEIRLEDMENITEITISDLLKYIDE